MRYTTALIIALLPLALAGCGEPPDNHPDKPVTHRREAFQKILKAFEPMGQQLRKDQYDAGKFATLAKQLASHKDEPWSFFGPDTNYPPTQATDRLWQEPEKYEVAKQAFLKATDQLSQAAESKDEKQVRAAYEALHDTCRSCHKAFKK